MRGTRRFLILVFLVGSIYYIHQQWELNQTSIEIEEILYQKKSKISPKQEPIYQDRLNNLDGQLYKWMGKTTTELKRNFGPPRRKDLSSYGYVWWIYTNSEDRHIQFGVENGTIQTIFATGEGISISPVGIGQTYHKVSDAFDLKKELSFSKGLGSYRFNLTHEDLRMRPLAQISNEVFAQFYFDTFTNKLSSIRLLGKNALLLQRPYDLFYKGNLPESPLLTKAQWIEIEQGMEQQIFEITNVIRQRYDTPSLDWDRDVAEVAFGHSKDMAINNYFSHYSLKGNGLRERLEKEKIHYLSAGENIAAQYTDGPAAVEGWLNSEGHREALLKENYTHLGVGVYRNYFTQNFLEKLDLTYQVN